MTSARGQEQPDVRQTASASTGGRILQAGRDLTVHEVHHHRGATETAVLVEPVLPTEETVSEVFVGRDTEVDAVLAILDPDTDTSGMVVVSAVAGLAGIGKTALARVSAAAGVSRGWFPGGAVFVDLKGYEPKPENRILPHQVYSPLLHALGREGPLDAVPQGQAAQYHRFLADRAAEDRPVLLVLDNASTTHQIADLLPSSRKHRVVVTSRHTLTARGSRTLDLRTLASDDSASLIGRQLELLAPQDRRLHDDPAGTRRLCDLCGHLPLALHIVTALLARDPGLSPTELADDLARARSRLDVLDDGERAVRAAFELSYVRLQADQAHLFRLLPINPGPHFGVEAAARLMDVAARKARPLLHELARAHVIEQAGHGRWRQHDLIRAYAIELLGDHGVSQEAPSQRLLRLYATESRRAGNTLRAARGKEAEGADNIRQALAWFDQEQPNLQAAIAMGLTFGDTDQVLPMLEALIRLHRYRDQTAELVETCRKVVTVTGDNEPGERPAWALAGLAWTLGALARQSNCGQSAELERLLDSDTHQFRFTNPYSSHERADQLLASLLDAVRAYADSLLLKDRLTAVPMFQEVARASASVQPDSPTALSALQAASTICRRNGDPRLRALSWALLGREQIRLDRPARAVEPLEQALQALPRYFDPRSSTWRETFDLLISLTDELGTERAAEIAADVRRRSGDPAAEAQALNRSGAEHHRRGAFAAAAADHREALRLLEQHRPDDRKALGQTLIQLSMAHFGVRDHAAAAEAAERAADLLDGLPDEGGAAESACRARELIVYALLALRRREEALTAARRAERLASPADNVHSHLSATLMLALALREAGQYQDSQRVARQAVRVSVNMQDRAVLSNTRTWLRREGLPTD